LSVWSSLICYIVIEWRYGEGKQDRQRALAAELARLKVDVIVAVGTGDIRAAKAASAIIPIVMISGEMLSEAALSPA
jgi:ABC-type uncharacterized transport system substrate-binding protein